MANTNYTGVYKTKDGYWAYRYSVMINGQKKDIKKAKDNNGQRFPSAKAASKARAIAMAAGITAKTPSLSLPRRTISEVYQEYCEKGRTGKAYQTIRKQDSLWRNHLSSRFGSRYIDEVSVAEINDYLSSLYYTEGRSWRYVESFLKMFYLIFGQAYSRNYLCIEQYNHLCVNKDGRIQMPKMKTDDDTDIVVFSRDEVNRLDDYFRDTNAETAYLLGRNCGLRINECYGLKWDHIDLEKGTILIDRQMQYQEGLVKLVSLKTRNARRTIYMNSALQVYLSSLFIKTSQYQQELFAQREQNQRFIEDIDGKRISSLELVNSLPNGKLQTVNSMKYHSRTIKAQLHINFKYHYLRHTYGTRMAELNTPTHLLCNQMGHASGKVTERYYLGMTKAGVEGLVENLNKL